MTRHGLRVFAVVSVLAGAFAACDRPTSPLAPATTAVSPQLSLTSGGYFIGGWKLLPGHGSSMQTTLDVIDQRGGKLSIGGSSLEIPAGAVSGSTLFVFTLQTDPYITAKLVAMSMTWPSQGKLVTTFSRALTLTISYADASQVPNADQAKVLWIENNTLLGVQPTVSNPQGKTLTASITHFTDYTPGVPGCGAGSLNGCDNNL